MSQLLGSNFRLLFLSILKHLINLRVGYTFFQGFLIVTYNTSPISHLAHRLPSHTSMFRYLLKQVKLCFMNLQRSDIFSECERLILFLLFADICLALIVILKPALSIWEVHVKQEICFLTLSQTTNFRLLQTERPCRRHIQI